MAGYFRYTAVLDACVLYPAPLRDLLISLAEEGLFRARWTKRIQDEWIRNLIAKRKDIAPEAVAKTAALMADAIEDAIIENADHLIDSLVLPDPDDRHVLAAAIVGHADAIITFNLKDFPESSIVVHGIEVLHPDDFLVAQYDLDSIKFLSVVKGLRARLRNPKKSPEELIATFEQQGIPQTCKLLREAIELI
ncbi:PIN domain-containing protein [Duganella sp. LX20W]|uniref:PIN domain-containing protein n=1 Tax=Rugamonas brunnea TaxID=2758569 RepID=A0A7W2IB16_9BURK|nr:PIN domain-containing protein [Rugamonas brunnea]MBA5636675.1 PIN domain-containing protein [Rugamonas brunnea]